MPTLAPTSIDPVMAEPLPDRHADAVRRVLRGERANDPMAKSLERLADGIIKRLGENTARAVVGLPVRGKTVRVIRDGDRVGTTTAKFTVIELNAALDETGGNMAAAARLLDVSPSTVWARCNPEKQREIQERWRRATGSPAIEDVGRNDQHEWSAYECEVAMMTESDGRWTFTAREVHELTNRSAQAVSQKRSKLKVAA